MSVPGLGRRSLLDDLTGGLVRLIEEDGYQIGDRLPSMSALATRFGVATPTLREAARRLEATGALTFRHGSGVYVTGETQRMVIANPTLAGIADETALEVLDSRLLIEPALAERAAARADAAQITELEEVLTSVGRALEDGPETTITQLNMRFHVLIAKAAGNRVMTQTLQSIVELYEPQQRVVGRLYDDRQHDHDEHGEILAAIVAHDSARAGELMRAHLEDVLTVVTRKLERSGIEITPTAEPKGNTPS